jgi:chloramphenicol-sensitive protein RarD
VTATAVPPSSIAPPARHSSASRAGFFYALGAYLAWGAIPSYFKLLADVPPLLVLGHRIVWSVLFLGILLTATRRWSEVKRVIADRKTLGVLVCSTALIAVNWYVFIWAVANGRILQASLGYFINPLVNVLLGVVILRERLRPGQIVGLFLATAGVVVLTISAHGVPWVALSLAFSFSLYGLLRKTAAVGPLAGLSIETAMLFPLALIVVLGILPMSGHSPDARIFSHRTYALLMAAGVITAVPLLLFAAGARRLRFSTLGFLQYVSPTCQFFLAVLVYDEPFKRDQLLSFALIWAAIAVYMLETIWTLRGPRTEEFEPVPLPD